MIAFAALFASLVQVSATDGPWTPLVALRGSDECSRCAGHLLPGELLPRLDWPLRIDSDLPELFRGVGVLYATTSVLPPFDMQDGRPVPEAMRKQVSAGFAGIDGAFEVFLYHFVRDPEDARQPVRIVVHARNLLDEDVLVEPRQSMATDGPFAEIDGPEVQLGRALLCGAWTRPIESVRLAARQGRAIGWTPVLQAAEPGADATASGFVNGLVRAELAAASGGAARVEVHVVAVPGSTPIGELSAACEALLARGARSQETMDLSIPPPKCHVRRVSGVSRNVAWRGGARIDATRLGADGLSFLMAAPEVQTRECREARQTAPMLLHPPYVHPETIGNYLVEHEVELRLANPGTTPLSLDLRFGKHDADIGLAWQVLVGDELPSRAALRAAEVQAGWAGKWKKDDLPDDTRSFLAQRIVVPPAGEKVVALRFVPLPSASMPFALKLVRD